MKRQPLIVRVLMEMWVNDYQQSVKEDKLKILLFNVFEREYKPTFGSSSFELKKIDVEFGYLTDYDPLTGLAYDNTTNKCEIVGTFEEK